MESYELTLVENAEVESIVGAPLGEVMGGGSFTFDLDATETDDDNYFTIDAYGQIRVGEIDFRRGRAGIDYPDSTDANATPDMEDPVLDFEGTNVFRLVVTATDSADSKRKARTNVTIGLTDLNEEPYFDKASRDDVTGTIDYAEARVNRVVPLAATEPDDRDLRWEVAGTDAADFHIIDVDDIPGDGKDRVELHFKSQPNYEKPTDRRYSTVQGDIIDPAKNNMYNITVRAVEMTAVGGGPNLAAELDVIVQVTNSEEPGKVEVKWLQPEVNTPLPAMLTDPDIPDGSITWQWYRAKNSNPDLDPDIATLGGATSDWEAITDPGNGSDSDTYTPQGKTAAPEGAPATGTAADEGWKLLVKADYADVQGTDKSAIGTTYLPVRADVHDDQNNSPDFRHDTTAKSVPEDTLVGANVGAPVEVDTDEDNDTLTYTLDNDKNPATPFGEPVGADTVGNAAAGNAGDVAYFSIDKKTGQIKVKKSLDWDNNPEHPMDADGKYVVWVRATDPSGEGVASDGSRITDTANLNYNEDTDYIKVTITATDVNEAPRVTGGRAEISIYEVDDSKKDSDVAKFVGLGYEIAGDATEQTLIATAPNLYRRLDYDRVDSGRWSIGGLDGSHFEYSTPIGEQDIGRRLHFKKTNLPDYEMPMDDNRDNVYEVTLIVQDNEGLRGMQKVRITVMNVDEKGKLVLSPEQPDTGTPVTATLMDPDGEEIITDWNWYSTTSRFTKGPTDLSAIRDSAGSLKAGVTLQPYSTTNEHTGMVGQFLWAEVHYRDGASVDDDPVTALDERNDNPDSDNDPSTTGTAEAVEHHKFEADSTDMLFHNSDRMMEKGTENAVRIDPAGDADPATPSLDVVMIDRMVYENVPSTGYVGIPLGYYDLRYPDGKGGDGFRDTIGGPDVASFVFAEDKDNMKDDGYYDSMLVDGPANDKHGQLAAAVATHFDAEGTRPRVHHRGDGPGCRGLGWAGPGDDYGDERERGADGAGGAEGRPVGDGPGQRDVR